MIPSSDNTSGHGGFQDGMNILCGRSADNLLCLLLCFRKIQRTDLFFYNRCFTCSHAEFVETQAQQKFSDSQVAGELTAHTYFNTLSLIHISEPTRLGMI